MKPSSFLPLKPVWFHILVTVADKPTHGYAIRQEVEARTEGSIRLWPTTLYGTLSQLEEAGLIEELPASRSEDEARRTYRLTTLGHQVLVAETKRLDGLLRAARVALSRKRMA